MPTNLLVMSKQALCLAYLEENNKVAMASTRVVEKENSKQQQQQQVMVVGMDESECSAYALEWTLDYFFTPFASNPLFKLVIVHAKPSPSAMALTGPGGCEVLPNLEADLKKIAVRVVEKAKKICASKLMHDVVVEVVAGGVRNVLCEAVEKHKASILVSGSHGYGAIKRAVLGSVSDYCAHHAQCTVMIVKRPKIKN